MKAHEADLEPAIVAPRNWHAAFLVRRKARLQRCRDLQPRQTRQRSSRFRQPRIRSRRPLRRSEVRQPRGDLGVLSLRLELARAPARQVPLPRGSASPPAGIGQLRTPGRAVRRLEHRAQGNRPAQLALEPEKLRFPARGAHLDHARVRRDRLRGRFPPPEQPARPVHLVVEPRRCMEQERRLAHRLPRRHRGPGEDREEGIDLQDQALFRSRAAHDRLRLDGKADPGLQQRIPGWRFRVEVWRCPAACCPRAAGRDCAACGDRATRPAPAAWRNRRA